MTDIQNVKISKLKLLEKNPRRIDADQFQKLCKSITDDPAYLYNRPVLVNDKGGVLTVYAGNQRVRAAKEMGWKEIPCIIDQDLPDELIHKRIILDNKTFGEFDYDLLANDYDMQLLLDCGFTADELVGAVQDINTESEEDGNEVLEPAKDEDAITKLGDVYDLDGHIIVCGDSTMPDNILPHLERHQPILMVTDPPYGVEYDPSWRKDIKGKHGVAAKAMGKVQNDDKINWAVAWSIFPGSIAYVWHAGKYCSEVQLSLEQAEFEIKNQIVWVKQHFALSRGDYHWQHEPCWYAIRKGHKHNWQGSRKECTIWEISNLNAFGGKKEEGEERTAHSTQKPMECMAKPIRNNTSEGEYVYDPFLGSGTTLIAAEQLKRKCIGVELSPGYVDIIVNRWINWRKKKGLPHNFKKNKIEMDDLCQDQKSQ